MVRSHPGSPTNQNSFCLPPNRVIGPGAQNADLTAISVGSLRWLSGAGVSSPLKRRHAVQTNIRAATKIRATAL
jgi:hypothetical protein